MYLGYDTIFGSPGAGRGTLSSGWGVGAMICLPRMQQVRNYLDILYIYFADIFEWN